MLPNLILVILVIQPAVNLPQKRSTDSAIISVLQQDIIPVAVKDVRKKKGFNIAYHQLPVHHHLLLPSQLHVLPATSNVQHSSVHSGVQHIITSNGQVPVYSQTVSHSSTNITHPTQLVPILVPVQHNIIQHNLVSHQNHPQHNFPSHNLIPQQHLFHDLSVIPLHRAQKFNQLRAKERQAEDRDDVNRFRTFYGGYGTGLYFGGHGAGHGFYAYGK